MLVFNFIMSIMEVKRRPVSAGDLVTLVAESLDGLGVIQAYGKQQYFTEVCLQVAYVNQQLRYTLV